jgi:hypothetical protein
VIFTTLSLALAPRLLGFRLDLEWEGTYERVELARPSLGLRPAKNRPAERSHESSRRRPGRTAARPTSSKEDIMSKLSPRRRAKLPAKAFGLPEKARTAEARKETGNYPMPDPGHAVSAKRLSRKQRKAGNLTRDEFERINRKADKVLRENS